MKKYLPLIFCILALFLARDLFAIDATFCTHRWTDPSGMENASYYWQCSGDYDGDVGDRAAESRDVTIVLPHPSSAGKDTGNSNLPFKEIVFEIQSSDACGHSWYVTKADGTCVAGDCGSGEWYSGMRQAGTTGNTIHIWDRSWVSSDKNIRVYSNYDYVNNPYFYIRFKHSGVFCSTHHGWIKVNVKGPGAKANGTMVFLHGFIGWGPSEAGGSNKYWGLLGANDSDAHYRDIVDGMKRRGMDARTAVVGPVSSNHDRACELFAQLTNASTVYYGNAHSQQFGHLATVAATSNNFKMDNWAGLTFPVHIISHSMGGQTARKLVDLINKNQCAGEDPNSVFCYKTANPAGASALIASITTISTPHNGTTLTWGVDHLLYSVFKQHADEIYDDVMWLYGSWLYNDGFAFAKGLYNLKLDQWSGVPEATMNNSPDMSFYDLSPAGAKAQNQTDAEDPNIYYFSWVTARGAGDDGAWCTKPNMTTPSMLGCLANFAINSGEWTRPAQWGLSDSNNEAAGTTTGDPNYWGNHDGVVNVWSQAGPRTGRKPGITSLNWVNIGKYTLQKGKWYNLGFVNEDHLSITGAGCPEWGVADYFMSAVGEVSSSDSKTANTITPQHAKGDDKHIRIADWYENLCNFLRTLN